MPCLVFPLLLSCWCWVSGILAGGFPLALKNPKTFDFGFSPKAFSIGHAEGKRVLNNSTIREGSGVKGRQTSCVSASGKRKRVFGPQHKQSLPRVFGLCSSLPCSVCRGTWQPQKVIRCLSLPQPVVMLRTLSLFLPLSQGTNFFPINFN